MTFVRTVDAVCDTCGAADSVTVARARDFEFDTCENEFEFVRCTNCGLTYLKNRPDVAELPVIYPERYYRYNERLGSLVVWLRSRSLRAKVRAIARWIPEESSVLEVGCGDGQLLRIARSLRPSWCVAGVDMSPVACRSLTQAGIRAHCTRFEELRGLEATQDAVVMNQLIEHVESPTATLEQVHQVLRPGGIVSIETPCVDAWDARIFRERCWGGWHCPRHWYLYDRGTVQQALSKTGFDVQHVSYLLSPYAWLHSLQNHALDRQWSALAVGLLSERSLPALAAVCATDVVQRTLTRRTSNMRVIARRR